MLRYFYLLLFFIPASNVFAADTDSLFVVKKANHFAVKYTVKPRESVKMLARRFYVSENVLEYANEYQDMKKLTPGMVIYIPVTKENQSSVKPTLNPNVREMYYHVAMKDDINVLSTYAGVTKVEFRTWNGMKGNSMKEDDVLFVGWVKMMVKDSTNPESEFAYPAEKKKRTVFVDTVKIPVPGGLDTVYKRQTSNGQNMLTEKGTVVFFEKPGKNDVYYAFHNTTPKGTVVKVFNPGTGRTTYVKIVGPIPGTKIFTDCIMAISTTAMEALGLTDTKAWCELSYSPY